MRPLYSGIISTPGSPKNMDLETVSYFAAPNHRKSRNYAQSGSQEAPKIHPKIDKNGHLGLSVSLGCPLGPQDHQNGAQGTQKGTPRDPKRYLKVTKITDFLVKSDPIEQSTGHAGTSTAMGLRGRRQGAKPLR